MVKRQATVNKSEKNKYDMKDVYEQDYKERDSGGAKRIGYLNISKFEGVEFYTVKEGRNEIDIIPFIITTSNHPKGREKGKSDYKLDIWVHRYVGEQEGDFLCLKETFGKPCPICEDIKRMIASQEYTFKDDEIRKLKAKHREVYNVVDLSDDEQKVKLFDFNHFEFQKDLIEEAEAGEDGIITFADPEEGKTIVFRGSEREGKEFKESFKPKNFKFVDREPIDEEILEQAYPLDAMLIIPSYEDVKKAYFGISEDDEEPEEKEEEEDEAPKKRKRVEEEDEAPKKKSGSKDKETEDCPAGGKFGKDCDELEDCKKCKKWEECSEAFSG